MPGKHINTTNKANLSPTTHYNSDGNKPYGLIRDPHGTPTDRGRIRTALLQPFAKALSITLEFKGKLLTATGKDLNVDFLE